MLDWQTIIQLWPILKTNNTIKKYDIWLVDLEPTRWWEQAWVRPCLVFQSNIVSRYTTTFLIIPITSKIKNLWPIVVKIWNYKDFWLEKESLLLSYQLRTVDKTRFIKKLWNIADKKMRNEIKESVKISLDIDDDF